MTVRRRWTCYGAIKAQIKRYLTIALALMGCLVSPEWASGSRPVGAIIAERPFFTSEQKLQELSPSCDTGSIPNFKQTFSWACRTMARERSAAKAYEEALRYINRFIETDPAKCEFYVTRSEIYKPKAARGLPEKMKSRRRCLVVKSRMQKRCFPDL